MEHNRERLEANRVLWDGWAEMHLETEFYDVEGFVADPSSRPFDPIVREVVGSIQGRRLLHLQCHFGLDTLRLALLGADVTGVDFSAKGIRAARELSKRTGIPARFVETDVLSLAAEIEEAAFDVVFTSYGVISWLPDLRPWAASIASRLKPGGVFHIVELHPTAWIFDEEAEEPPLRVRYGYFDRSSLRWEEKGSYAAPDGEFEGVSYSWQHTFEEILGSLLAEGLQIVSLKEYDRIAWRHLPFMTEDDDGMWRMPTTAGDIPLLFSLTARKPE